MGVIRGQQLAKTGSGLVGGYAYRVGGGHSSTPGPTYVSGVLSLDCSGYTRWVVALVSGRDLFGPSTSESQWDQSLGGRVPASNDLLPGDIIARRGDGSFPSPGHIAICVSYNKSSREIVCVSALGRSYGIREDTISRDGSQYVGAFRVANEIDDPAPPKPPPIPRPKPNPKPVPVGDNVLLHDINLVLGESGQETQETKIPFAKAVSATILAGGGPVLIDEVSMANAGGFVAVVVKGGPPASRVTVRVAEAV